MERTRDLALYIAFPCTLASPAYGPSRPYVADSPAKAAYVDAVEAELASLDDETRLRPVRAVRLGGGASIMKADKVCKLVRDVRKALSVEPRAEVSVEVNPLTVCTPSLTDWTGCGVTRVNLDVDSVLDAELSALGATHTRDDVCNAFLFLDKFHMARVDVRLRYGLPRQSVATWKQSLLTAVDLGAAHITVRPLVESDPNKASELPGRDVREEMYRVARDVLAEKGYREYMVGMFCAESAPHARDGYECALRTGADRLSLGAGASSCCDGFLYENALDFDLYVQKSADFEAIVRNPRREGVAARQVRLLEGALDMLGPARLDADAADGACDPARGAIESEAQAWLDGLAAAGRIERVPAEAGDVSGGSWRLTDLGRFERNEELGRSAAL